MAITKKSSKKYLKKEKKRKRGKKGGNTNKRNSYKKNVHKQTIKNNEKLINKEQDAQADAATCNLYNGTSNDEFQNCRETYRDFS